MSVSKSSTSADQETVITMDRRRSERRTGDPDALDNADRENGEIKAPRRKKQRRRHIDPTTCERDYNNEEIEFMRAMDDYKRDAGRMFPTCSEVLEVIRALGYVKLSEEEIAQLRPVDSDFDVESDESTDEFADATDEEPLIEA